jgi:glycosyltransferase involved in cell wall biosynthesis
VLALLTWDTRQPSLESVAALLQEVRTLTRLGHRPSLCVCDNGSTDGTAQSLRDLDPTLNVERQLILNDRNLGNSIARNQIIDHALEIGADYVLFVDGDIEIVPFSSLAMLRYLEGHGHRLGCIGAHFLGQSNARAETTRALWAVDPARTHVTDSLAWTQYGMFRCEMFAEGLRFETASPFNGAGWGFEDNDLAFQMAVAGYDNHYFTGMTYLHRDARSSLRVMRTQGIDAAGLYEARRRFLLDKWAAIPRIASGPLREVARVTIPSF